MILASIRLQVHSTSLTRQLIFTSYESFQPAVGASVETLLVKSLLKKNLFVSHRLTVFVVHEKCHSFSWWVLNLSNNFYYNSFIFTEVFLNLSHPFLPLITIQRSVGLGNYFQLGYIFGIFLG